MYILHAEKPANEIFQLYLMIYIPLINNSAEKKPCWNIRTVVNSPQTSPLETLQDN